MAGACSAVTPEQLAAEVMESAGQRATSTPPSAASEVAVESAVSPPPASQSPAPISPQSLQSPPARAASAGAACHAAPADAAPVSAASAATVSHVLRAMGVPPDYAIGTLRLSVGRHTTREEVLRAADAIIAAVQRHRAARAAAAAAT